MFLNWGLEVGCTLRSGYVLHLLLCPKLTAFPQGPFILSDKKHLHVQTDVT